MVVLYVVRMGLQRKEGTTVKLIVYADQVEKRNFIKQPLMQRETFSLLVLLHHVSFLCIIRVVLFK